MAKKPLHLVLQLEKIVGGGQTLGTLDDGRKAFVWGGLPGETVEIMVTKKKSKLVEGYVTNVLTTSKERVVPTDPDSYLSTSPWQIMDFAAEQVYKARLIDEAFALHSVQLPKSSTLYSNTITTQYRNKVEFSWYGHSDENGNEILDLAFHKRGSKGKIIISQCSLLPDTIMQLALEIRDILQQKNIPARSLKTLLIRCNQSGECVWQLYTKEKQVVMNEQEAASLPALGGEIIYSDPRSPASKITERLARYGKTVLEDTILGTPFRYATEGFFQVNLPVYEQALRDMRQWIPKSTPTVDMYSGVGSIGLTIGGPECILIEIDENAVREMKRNIAELGSNASAVLASSETALEYITGEKTIILDPPRAGLHPNVVQRLLEVKPKRILYLSCNPVTQARDVAELLPTYHIAHNQGYNFFPRTPHIEHFVVLDV